MIECIFDYVVSKTENVAFGTYVARGAEKNEKNYIAKTIRHIHNAELARQLIVLINETFKDDLVAPSHSTLMKILAIMKSTRGRVNSCIDATQDAERKGTLFLESLW